MELVKRTLQIRGIDLPKSVLFKGLVEQGRWLSGNKHEDLNS